MTEMTMAIVAIKTVVLLLGGGITYIALRAYRRTGEKSLRALCIGFGIITLGAGISGVANQIFSVSLELGVLVNSIFLALGLAVILYSLSIQ
jgi:heme/copper-type cytochrome/quinol oxidase subunit 3